MRARGVPRKARVRLTFVVANLACGGVQRVTAWLSVGLARRGHQVTVITFADEASDFFRLPPDVSRVALDVSANTPTPLWRLAPVMASRLARIRRAVQSSAPDAVISRAAPVNVPTLLALHGLGYPVVVTEHGDTPAQRDASAPWPWRKWLWYRMRRLCYPAAFAVLSASATIDRRFSWLPASRRTVIHNPFPRVHKLETHGAGAHRPRIASMGRLSPDKGFDVLLRAFARIAGRFREWQLVIVGDGKLREELQRLAHELAVSEQVVFTGAVADPSALLQSAQLYAMASRCEGFPNALGEAMSCGLPVVATDCPGGVRELVRERVDGCLVPPDDPGALADALADLMADPAKRAQMGARAGEVVERFACEKILDDWEWLLQRAAVSGGVCYNSRPRARSSVG
jgi:GalNAc-alpha-(1->4)-GalNAc-alpha-(1->3)-diNAcBac-PP-undecaprenol alpha-1,4-N-acetyl-D-galactosaminyltransferase